jgi:hypothetical protein
VIRRAASWFGVVTALSWGWALLSELVLRPRLVSALQGDLQYLVTALPFLVMPLLGTWVWRRLQGEASAPNPDAMRFDGTLIAAWVGPVVLVWVAAGIAHVAGWATIDLGGAGIVARLAATQGQAVADAAATGLAESVLPHPVLVSIDALVMGVLIATLRWPEEMGWRGVLLRELAPLGFWNAALLTAILWGVWRIPLFLVGGFFPGHDVLAAVVVVAVSLPLGALLAWVRVAAGSVWASALAAGVMAVLGPFHEVILVGGDPLVVSPMGVAGGVAALIPVLVLFARRPRGPREVPA